MSTLTDSEQELVSAIQHAVSAAIEDLEDVSPEYANKTKLQKLLYLAIDNYSLPVTYSWYLAGSVVPDDPFTPDDLTAAPSDTVSSKSPSIGHSADDGSVLSPYTTEEELISFFKKEIPRLWTQKTNRFLQNFYQYHAPERYRELYVQCVHIRAQLKRLTDVVETATRGIDIGDDLEEIDRALGLSISDFHYYLSDLPELEETFDPVFEGTELIEDTMMMLTKRSTFTHHHLGSVKALNEFFYYYVWRYPSLIISAETATGPAAEEIRTSRQREAVGFETRIETEREQLTEQLDQFDLKPTFADFPSIGETETNEQLLKATRLYLEKND
ncbi:hypothetical protein AUR64_03835 [Haloprofundus marisrubri]|uniref:DUF8098 domain-containing protein n=1 Tax=Haloprofundus marisrubri TaxID=1514971 RepID=A0A0W1RFH1_9EURY|nr:hypothetical protein [Haloprofundus marisrubri]KTG11396.1 hypothetical protein AUR64_03835 [Haloprofundus marisrubri]